MSVAFTKFNSFTDAICKKVHNLGADSLKVMLTNSAPVATNTQKTDLTDIGAGGGYTAGGTATTPTLSNASGVEKLVCTDVVFTGTGGGFGPFRYAVLYNDTATNKELIGWADYGSSISRAATETFTVDFDGSAGVLTVG